jgi:hypothetical protein
MLNRIAHCTAYQLLVRGVFNGEAVCGDVTTTVISTKSIKLLLSADPHAGNLMICPYVDPSSGSGECSPGLLDYGMTVR